MFDFITAFAPPEAAGPAFWLPLVWAGLLAIAVAMYVVADGFDLGVGILFSCAGFAPGSLIDAIGRPEVTACFALTQALVFLPLAALVGVWQNGGRLELRFLDRDQQTHVSTSLYAGGPHFTSARAA